jgi:hypothetical protein
MHINLERSSKIFSKIKIFTKDFYKSCFKEKEKIFKGRKNNQSWIINISFECLRKKCDDLIIKYVNIVGSCASRRKIKLSDFLATWLASEPAKGLISVSYNCEDTVLCSTIHFQHDIFENPIYLWCYFHYIIFHILPDSIPFYFMTRNSNFLLVWKE